MTNTVRKSRRINRLYTDAKARRAKKQAAERATAASASKEEIEAQAQTAYRKVKGLQHGKKQKRGTSTRSADKLHTSVHFHRPRTLKLPRSPKYPRRSRPHAPRLHDLNIIKYPLTNEGVMQIMEGRNTLVFIVDLRANKPQIRNAVKKVYNVEALKVNTLIRPDGLKKAYVRLTSDHDALDVANKIGIC